MLCLIFLATVLFGKELIFLVVLIHNDAKLKKGCILSIEAVDYELNELFLLLIEYTCTMLHDLLRVNS